MKSSAMAAAWFLTFLLKAFVRRVDRPYGPTVTEAMRALEASFDAWRQEQLPKRQ
jgi:hypothetical protein